MESGGLGRRMREISQMGMKKFWELLDIVVILVVVMFHKKTHKSKVIRWTDEIYALGGMSVGPKKKKRKP